MKLTKGRHLTACIAASVMMLFLVLLLAGCGLQSKTITSPDQLNDPGVTIGVVTDTSDGMVVEKEFPKANIEYFRGEMNGFVSVSQGKIDAFVFSKITMNAAIRAGLKGVKVLDEPVGEPNRGAVVISDAAKIPGLEDKVNEFIDEIKADGTLDDMKERWIVNADETMPDIKLPETSDIHLVVGTTGTNVPFTYYKGTELAGYDIELAYRFASWLGATIEFKVYDYDGIIAASDNGEIDCIFADFFITPERAEAVTFSQPTSIEEVGIMVRDSSSAGAADSIRNSFERTFLRENRWKLFVSGIITTLVITSLSVLLGTLLGFAVYMLCRKGNRFANKIAAFCIWLIQGMPVVVLLMIMYYVIFSGSGLSGASVSIIGFTLIFAAEVFNMLKGGTGAVDIGQTEAAYSLGYTDPQAFFRIVLPQAMPHFMPGYKAQITALMKATAVVGYLAVQDLTKMGDLVRSRTYEAFFPLIAVAIIYFILAAILKRIVGRIEIKVDPRQRPAGEILKGIEKHD